MTIDVDMRSSLGPARDHGARPTCLAFAATAAHEASRASDEYLCVEHLYYFGVQKSHRNPNRGLNQASVVAALKEDGQPLEPEWAYSQTTPDAATWRPPTVKGPLYKTTLAFSPRVVNDVHALIRASIPVVLLVTVTTALYRPDAEGVVQTGPSDATTGRHALLAVGSGDTTAGCYLLVRNSWGPTWGDQGHAWLPDSYVAANLRGTGLISTEGRS
jgi:C1A family cysteine protease